jgi:hypothetical protein
LPAEPLLAEQSIQLRFGFFSLALSFIRIDVFLRPKIVAEIGVLLVADFFGDRFAAMFGLAQIVKLAKLARVQIGAALFADVAPRKRQS